MLIVDAVTPVVVPACGSPQAPLAAGLLPPGVRPPPMLATLPPLLLPPATTDAPPPSAAAGPGPVDPGTVTPPGPLDGPVTPGRPLLFAAATAPGDPDLRVAVASGFRPHAVVSDVSAMAPASSCKPVRGRFIVVSGVRGLWRSGTAGESGAVPGGIPQHPVETAAAACADRLGLVAENERHEQEQQGEGRRTDPESAARHGRGGDRLRHRLQLGRQRRRDLRRRGGVTAGEDTGIGRDIADSRTHRR